MNSNSPLSGHTLFLDRNFGRLQVAAALRADGLRVEVHHDHFPAEQFGESSDEYWIRSVTERGWVILTRNGRIRHNPLERQTFIDCRSRVFNIRNGNANAEQIARCIRLAAGKMATILGSQAGPYIVGLSLGGELTFVDPPESADL